MTDHPIPHVLNHSLRCHQAAALRPEGAKDSDHICQALGCVKINYPIGEIGFAVPSSQFRTAGILLTGPGKNYICCAYSGLP